MRMRKKKLRYLLLFMLFISLNGVGQENRQRYVIADVYPSPITIGGREVYEGDTVFGSSRIELSGSKQRFTVIRCDKAGGPAEFNYNFLKTLTPKTVNNAWNHRSEVQDKDDKNAEMAPKGSETNIKPFLFFNGIEDSLLFGTEKRLAIVIGNSSYTKLDSLKKPMIDAENMQNKLVHLGFDVIEVRNATEKEMNDSFDYFFTIAREMNYDLVIVYYSGHGVWYEGKDYMLPIDAKSSNRYAKNRYYSANKLLNEFHVKVTRKSNDTNFVIIFDACRNPFGNTEIMEEEDSYPKIKENELLFYAVSVGENALQGPNDGNPSPFTQALIEGIGKGEKSIYDEFYDVKCVVKEKYFLMNPTLFAIGKGWFDNNSFVKFKRVVDSSSKN